MQSVQRITLPYPRRPNFAGAPILTEEQLLVLYPEDDGARVRLAAKRIVLPN